MPLDSLGWDGDRAAGAHARPAAELGRFVAASLLVVVVAVLGLLLEAAVSA